MNEKQHRVVCHIDDVKSYHMDPKVKNEFIQWTRDNYEDKEIGILNVHRMKKKIGYGAEFYHTSRS